MASIFRIPVSYERGTPVLEHKVHHALGAYSRPTCAGTNTWLGGLNVIRKEAWPFYRTSSGVRLCCELEEPKGPKGVRLKLTCSKSAAGGKARGDTGGEQVGGE